MAGYRKEIARRAVGRIMRGDRAVLPVPQPGASLRRLRQRLTPALQPPSLKPLVSWMTRRYGKAANPRHAGFRQQKRGQR
jgi:hypothetical protein